MLFRFQKKEEQRIQREERIEQEGGKIKYHPSRKLIYWVFIAAFGTFYLFGQLNLDNTHDFLQDTVTNFTSILRNENVPFEHIDDYLTDYIDKVEYNELKYRSKRLAIATLVMSAGILIMIVLEIKGVFILEEPDPRDRYRIEQNPDEPYRSRRYYRMGPGLNKPSQIVYRPRKLNIRRQHYGR